MTNGPIGKAWYRWMQRRDRWLLAHSSYERLARRSEALARARKPIAPETTEFERLVADAIDRLPAEFQSQFEKVPVVVSNLGVQHHAYGLYQGDGSIHETYPDRILIFQDTLERDFGHDRALLAAQVERTLRHELAHHLGWNENGVRRLGL